VPTTVSFFQEFFFDTFISFEVQLRISTVVGVTITGFVSLKAFCSFDAVSNAHDHRHWAL